MLKKIFSVTLTTLGVTALLALAPGVPQAFAATSKVIAIVVDFGSGSSKATISHCIRVSPSATEADAVQALITAQRGQSLRWASSGLLCGVDGYPTTGCGVNEAHGGYAYWAYFHGTAKGWVYANNGPAEVTAGSNHAVGLQFETKGKGAPSDPGPSVAPRTALACAHGVLDATKRPTPTPTHSAWMATLVAGGLIIILIPAAFIVLRIRRRAD
jgi:hypothetical protein